MRKIKIEVAKTGRSRCKKCKKNIPKNGLRIQMYDDREFQKYLRKNPQSRHCEGFSRGYFQTDSGVISIAKYFVHMKCYKPIHMHPIEPEYFQLTSKKAEYLEQFKEWIQSKNSSQKQNKQETVKKATSRQKNK